jgi:hypothetical protein
LFIDSRRHTPLRGRPGEEYIGGYVVASPTPLRTPPLSTSNSTASTAAISGG